MLTSARTSFAGFWRSIASGAAAGVAFGATVSAVRLLASAASGLVRNWENSARAYAKMSAILKQTGYAAGITTSEATKLAAALQTQTGASDEATASVIALLAAQKSIKGDNLKRAAAMAIDLAEGLKSSNSEASNVEGSARTLAMALADPGRGMDRLRRAGVLFTAAQEKQIKAMQAAGQTAKAQAFMLDSLEAAWGGAAAAANKATGGLATLRETIGDVREAMGTAIANSKAFADGVKKIQDAASALIASGAIELWVKRTAERMEWLRTAIAPVIAGFTAIMDGSARLGAFGGALAGGASMGEAWSSSAGAGDRVRQQHQQDLADMRAAMAAEAAARDKAELAAGESAARARRDSRRKELAKLAEPDTAPAGKDDPLGLAGIGTGSDKQDVAQVIGRIANIEASARQLLTRAIRDETDALNELDAAQIQAGDQEWTTGVLDRRAGELAKERAAIETMRKDWASAPVAVSTQQAQEAMADSPQYLAYARQFLRNRMDPNERRMRLAVGQNPDQFEPNVIADEARKIAEQATPADIQRKKAEMANARNERHAQLLARLTAAQTSADAKGKAIAEERARLGELATATAEEKAAAEAKAAKATQEQADAAKRIAQATKAAATAKEAYAKAASDAAKADALAGIARQLRALERMDPLAMKGEATHASQAAEFKERKRVEKDARDQDRADQKRANMLHERMRMGQSVSKAGREFLKDRADFKGAEAKAKAIEDKKAALEAKREALQKEGNDVLKEIRDKLAKNLEAS